jgi:hypothetical protein
MSLLYQTVIASVMAVMRKPQGLWQALQYLGNQQGVPAGRDFWAEA